MRKNKLNLKKTGFKKMKYIKESEPKVLLQEKSDQITDQEIEKNETKKQTPKWPKVHS